MYTKERKPWDTNYAPRRRSHVGTFCHLSQDIRKKNTKIFLPLRYTFCCTKLENLLFLFRISLCLGEIFITNVKIVTPFSSRVSNFIFVEPWVKWLISSCLLLFEGKINMKNSGDYDSWMLENPRVYSKERIGQLPQIKYKIVHNICGSATKSGALKENISAKYLKCLPCPLIVLWPFKSILE